MLKLNDRFSAKKYNRGWELHDKTKSENEKSKTGYKTDVTFYANLSLLCKAVIDKSLGECKSTVEIITKIDEVNKELSASLTQPK